MTSGAESKVLVLFEIRFTDIVGEKQQIKVLYDPSVKLVLCFFFWGHVSESEPEKTKLFFESNVCDPGPMGLGCFCPLPNKPLVHLSFFLCRWLQTKGLIFH